VKIWRYLIILKVQQLDYFFEILSAIASIILNFLFLISDKASNHSTSFMKIERLIYKIKRIGSKRIRSSKELNVRVKLSLFFKKTN